MLWKAQSEQCEESDPGKLQTIQDYTTLQHVNFLIGGEKHILMFCLPFLLKGSQISFFFFA